MCIHIPTRTRYWPRYKPILGHGQVNAHSLTLSFPFSANPSHRSLPVLLSGLTSRIPLTVLLILLSISVFLLFSFSLFHFCSYWFRAVVSFWAHVKITSLHLSDYHGQCTDGCLAIAVLCCYHSLLECRRYCCYWSYNWFVFVYCIVVFVS